METVSVEGLKDLEAALLQLPISTGKPVMRRALRKAAQPVADQAAALAPVDEGTLRDSIGVSSRLTRRQAKMHRRMFRDDRAAVEMFVGAGGLAQATIREFGGDNKGADPFLRPSWDSNKDQVVDAIKKEMWAEIEKAAKRLAKKGKL